MSTRKRTPTVRRVIVLFWAPDGFRHAVEATPDEVERLIAPAHADHLPVDGSTVDEDLRDAMLDRPEVNIPLDCKPTKIQMV